MGVKCYLENGVDVRELRQLEVCTYIISSYIGI